MPDGDRKVLILAFGAEIFDFPEDPTLGEYSGARANISYWPSEDGGHVQDSWRGNKELPGPARDYFLARMS